MCKDNLLMFGQYETERIGYPGQPDEEHPPRHHLRIEDYLYTACCRPQRDGRWKPIDWKSEDEWYRFQTVYDLVLLMYSVTDKFTLAYLEYIYPIFPVPPYGVNRRPQEYPDRRPWCYGRQPDQYGVQGLRLFQGGRTLQKDTISYVPLSKYKFFLVGCTPMDQEKWPRVESQSQPREVFPGDVQDFLRDKSEICYLGEVTLDNIAMIDNIVNTMFREMHELLRGAKQENDSDAEEPDVNIMSRLREACRNIINRIGRLVTPHKPQRAISCPNKTHSEVRSSESSN